MLCYSIVEASTREKKKKKKKKKNLNQDCCAPLPPLSPQLSVVYFVTVKHFQRSALLVAQQCRHRQATTTLCLGWTAVQA